MHNQEESEVREDETASASPKEMRHGSFRLARQLQPILICLAIVVFALFIYDKYFAVKIVALDFKGFVAEQRNLVMAKKIDETQFRRNVDSLERAIMNVPKNHVVIMGDAVLGKIPKVEIKRD